MFKIYNFFVFFFVSIHFITAQHENRYKIHSHNDYLQNMPFWDAYTNSLNSIEVDIFLKNDVLYATHSEEDIINNHTIENLYLLPLQKAIELRLGNQQEIQLLVDIKSEPYAALKKLMTILMKYPSIINSENISIVISGNRPSINEFINYPDYLKFDYQSLDTLQNKKVWDKIAMISLDYTAYTNWNGKGRMTTIDYKKVKTVIDKAHSYGKPFRFWATPDSKTAWKAFAELGVDYINTDMPFESSTYLETLKKRIYHNKIISKVYTPTFEPDQKNIPIKNVVLLIGDGNGLTQISSSTLANGGHLTLTQLKSIGFLKTQSADDFTTDSAAAGTTLATGAKTYNRAIGVDTSKQPLVNITELLSEHNFVSGCITTDKMIGATPAAFYAHQKDRSDEKDIARDLSKSKLSLFIGGGAEDFQDKELTAGFTVLDKVDAIGYYKGDKVGHFLSKKDVPSVLDGRENILAEATKNGLEFLNSKNKPFFLMVEGAQIDSFGHFNDVGGIVSEGIDFDTAVTEAIKFADKTKNTLVIVTADHETSGFSIPQGNIGEKMIEGDFITHDHTGVMVPLFAYGPHSQEFQGVYENSDLLGKIIKVLDLGIKGYSKL
ncbi:alkaline phosphatase [Zobellia laminariae]|uniref:alkaline phosphatase n=1 Tax=Zobellia laminariae TaxID=248906 RepID=UPI0012D90A94|nr:alkaline phosphatase [Zobellia laminariae]